LIVLEGIESIGGDTMKRLSYKELEAELARVRNDGYRLGDAVQAFGNGEVTWYGKHTYDHTQFRFGVFGLTRADGGHIVISSRVGKTDRWLTVVKLIDDAEYEMRNSIGSEYFGALGGMFYQAVRLRNGAQELVADVLVNETQSDVATAQTA
jgi:hypothetical protein